MPKEYKVESNVPSPFRGLYKVVRDMDVDESITFPRQRRPVMATYASRLKKDSGKVYTLSNVDEETSRIWRLK